MESKTENMTAKHGIFRSFLFTLIIFGVVTSGSRARAENATRDFLVSCTYGALAGTLVGAASLAFTDKPGENLNRVARGASLGLYAGILLGAYVVYGVPSDDEEATALLGRNSQWMLAPIMSERGWEGLSAQVRVLDF